MMPNTPMEMRIMLTVLRLCIVLSSLERLRRMRPNTNNIIAIASNIYKLMVTHHQK